MDASDRIDAEQFTTDDVVATRRASALSGMLSELLLRSVGLAASLAIALLLLTALFLLQ